MGSAPLWGYEERQFVEIVHDNGGMAGGGGADSDGRVNITGWFRLELDTTNCETCNVKLKRKTGRIRPWASAREVQVALNNLENAGHVDVERQIEGGAGPAFGPDGNSGSDDVVANAFTFNITFKTTVANMPLLELDTSELFGVDRTASKVTQMVAGSVPTNYCGSYSHEHTYCPEMLAEEGDLENNIFSYTIHGLTPGNEYFARVQAAMHPRRVE